MEKRGIPVRSHYSNGIIIIIFVIIFVILTVLASASYSVFGKKQNKIANADAFVEFIEENSNSANSSAKGNLTGYITLTQSHLNRIYSIQNQSFKRGAWFYGELDGHGYTIAIQADVTAPIFEKICEGANVKRINFECNTIRVVDGVDEIALLAKENYGTISDISIVGSAEQAGFSIFDFNNQMPTAASAICVRNYNNITQCAVKIRVNVSSMYRREDGQKLNAGTRWNCYFGAVAAYCSDNGNLHGAIVQVQFPNDFVPLSLRRYNENNDVNNRIGYFVGYYHDYSLIDREAKFYVVGGEYADNVTDYCNLPQNKDNVYSSIYASASAITSLWDGWKNSGFPQIDH